MKCHHDCHHYSRSLKVLVYPVNKGPCHHFYIREGERFLYLSPSYIRKVVTGQYLQGFNGGFGMVTDVVTEEYLLPHREADADNVPVRVFSEAKIETPFWGIPILRKQSFFTLSRCDVYLDLSSFYGHIRAWG